MLCVLAVSTCKERAFRGWVEKSGDGKSYLIVEDDCGSDPLYVDGKKWKVPKLAPGRIEPGAHVLSCEKGPNTGVGIIVKPSQVFHFDYWGP